MASAAAPNATTISETAVRLSISFCDAVALARVACASKWLSAVVHDIICGREDLLIPAAISLAVAHGGQQVQALNWLLNKVPNSPAVLQRVADRVLDIPCVDGKTASALTMRGLLFSWHDVVAAASRRVLGVEVWVGVGAVKDGCPPLASIISKQVLQAFYQDMGAALKQLQLTGLAGVLQLICNMQYGSDIVEDVLEGVLRGPLEQQVTPELLQQLLETACLRRNCKAIEALARFSAAEELQQHMVVQQWQAAVQRHDYKTALAVCSCFEQDQAPSAATVTAALQQALQRGDMEAHRLVVEGIYDGIAEFIPAMQDLPASAVVQLLESALQYLPWGVITTSVLLQLPGVETLDAVDIASLLGLAFQHMPPKDRWPTAAAAAAHGDEQCDPILLLLQVPAALHMESSAVAALLQVALQRGDLHRAQPLLQHAVARQLNEADIASLLSTVLQRMMTSCSTQHSSACRGTVALLCGLPGAAEIGVEALRQLLQGQAGRPWVLRLLLELPAAGSLDAATVYSLLLSQVSNQAVVQQLLQLPAAEKLDTGMVQTLLGMLVFIQHSDQNVEGLCKVPAAADLDAEWIACLAQVTLQSGHGLVASRLLQRMVNGCKGQPTTATLSTLLHAVVLQGTDGNIASVDGQQPLSMWSSACMNFLLGIGSISSEQLADLLLAAAQVRHPRQVLCLLSLPVAVQLTGSDICKVVEVLLGQGQHVPDNVRVVQELCQLNGASTITGAELQPLLRMAVQQQGRFRDQLGSNFLGSPELRPREPTESEKKYQEAWDEIVTALCCLPAALRQGTSDMCTSKWLQQTQVSELLQEAIQWQNPTAVICLCTLTAAAELEAQSAAALLASAAEHRLCSSRWHLLKPVALQAVHALLGLPSMQLVDSMQHPLQLLVVHQHVDLQNACPQCCCPLVGGMLRLPGSRRLGSSERDSLIALARIHGNLPAVSEMQASWGTCSSG